MKPILTTLIYGAAGIAVGLGGYLLQRLLAPRSSSSPEAKTPYECGETPIGSARDSWHWPFLPLATLLLLLEAEVLFALPWVWIHKTLSLQMALLELIILALPIGAVYAYLIRKGYLFRRLDPTSGRAKLPASYEALQTYLLKPPSRRSHHASSDAHSAHTSAES